MGTVTAPVAAAGNRSNSNTLCPLRRTVPKRENPPFSETEILETIKFAAARRPSPNTRLVATQLPNRRITLKLVPAHTMLSFISSAI